MGPTPPPHVAALRLPLRWPLSLQSVGSGAQGSVAVVRGLQSASSTVVPYGFSCSTACRIFPDQGSNSCLLHWQEPPGKPPKPGSAFPVLHYLCKACSWEPFPVKLQHTHCCLSLSPEHPTWDTDLSHSLWWSCRTFHTIILSCFTFSMDGYMSSFWFFLYSWWTPSPLPGLCSNITSLRSTPHHSLTGTPDFVFFNDFALYNPLYNSPIQYVYCLSSTSFH